MDRRQLLKKGALAGTAAMVAAIALADPASANSTDQQIDELAAQGQARANDARDAVARLDDSDEKEQLEYDAQQMLELFYRIGELTGHPSE